MRRVSLFLLACILTLVLLPVVASAEEGEFRVGTVIEYTDQNYGRGGFTNYGTDLGLLLGYEKQVSDSLWYSLDGKVLHGPRKTSGKGNSWRETDVRAVARIGTIFHNEDLVIKPFVGVGVNYADQDQRSQNNDYLTDYILPVGVSFEKDTDYGLIGTDIQYEYVVHREYSTSDSGETGYTSTFGGNCNVEVGLFFEPKGTSFGFRPYYRYEHANLTSAIGGWIGPYNKNSGGLEVYYRF